MKKSVAYKTILLLVGCFFAFQSFALKQVKLHVGDAVTIKEPARVSCEAADADSKADADRCDDFHSDSSCQKIKLGTTCKGSGDRLGICVSDGTFGGVLNCKCIPQ